MKPLPALCNTRTLGFCLTFLTLQEINENYCYGEERPGELESQDSIESAEYSSLYTSAQLDEILQHEASE